MTTTEDDTDPAEFVLPPKPNRLQLEALRKQKEELEARLMVTERAQRRWERARDTHRKILIGAMVLHENPEGTEGYANLMVALDAFLTRPQDREAFDLGPKNPRKKSAPERPKAEAKEEASPQVPAPTPAVPPPQQQAPAPQAQQPRPAPAPAAESSPATQPRPVPTSAPAPADGSVSAPRPQFPPQRPAPAPGQTQAPAAQPPRPAPKPVEELKEG